MLVLGPTIHLDRGVPLAPNPPFRVLQAFWPSFDMVRNIERLQVAFSLGLAVLGAQGLAWLADRWQFTGRRRWSGSRPCGHRDREGNPSADSALLPTAPTAVSVFDRIAESTDSFAVIHLPADDTAGGDRSGSSPPRTPAADEPDAARRRCATMHC